MSSRWAAGGLLLYVLVLAASILGPSPAELIAQTTEVVRADAGIESASYEGVERVGNVLLFIPLGLLLAAALPRMSPWLVWALCTLASLAVEVVQVVLPDRQPTLTDVLTNSAGAAVGVLLQRGVRWHRATRARAARSGTPHG